MRRDWVRRFVGVNSVLFIFCAEDGFSAEETTGDKCLCWGCLQSSHLGGARFATRRRHGCKAPEDDKRMEINEGDKKGDKRRR